MKGINSRDLSLIFFFTFVIFFLGSINSVSISKSALRQITLEQVLEAPPDALALGYLAVRQILLHISSVGRNHTSVIVFNGTSFEIDESNKDDYIAAFEERLGIYEKAINQRKSKSFSGTYNTTTTPGCHSLGFTQGAKTIVEQNGFQFALTHGQFQILSEGVSRGDFRFQGIMVGSTVVVEHPYSIDIHLRGAVQERLIKLEYLPLNCVVELSFQSSQTIERPTVSPLSLDVSPGAQKIATKKLAIPAQFDEADRFSEGLAAVVQNNKVGYVDRSGKFVIPPQFSIGAWLVFDDAYRFSEGLAAVMRSDKQWIYIDKTGKQAFPKTFSNAYHFSNGLAAVWVGNRLGYINRTGKLVIPSVSTVYDGKLAHFSEGLAGFFIDNEPIRIGFMDVTGKVVIPRTVYESQSFSEGLVAATPDPFGDWKWGYMDRTGKFVIPPQFAMAASFSEGLASALQYTQEDEVKKWGYVNRQGAWIIPPQFSYTGKFSEGLANVEIKDKSGYIDKTGKFIIQPQFDSADSFSEGLAVVGLRDQFGYIDKTGKFVIQPQFDSADSFSEGLAAVYINGKWGYISR